MIKMELKNRIKENRARLDITQEDLAKMVGISRVTLGTIEKGTRKVDLINAMKIAIVFDITVDSLFYL